MNQAIIILKEDLKRNPDLSHYLSDLSLRVKELEHTCAFAPKNNTIVDFILILNQNKIGYTMSSQSIDLLT